ncbi:MAG: glycosyltransferase family 2 protein [bacterium]
MSTFSIIIPVKTKRDLCPELLPAIHTQSLPPHELLIITDKICPGNPSTKRDYGASIAQGSVLAFLDADAYPVKNWLKNASKLLSDPKLAAVCGPNLTPPSDSLSQKTSGLVWSSFLGAGGAGLYRNKISPSRFVTDYPTSNLLVKRPDFQKINGFNTLFWPGEDTKLCHDLVYKLGKKILYHPDIQVFHHRRPIFLPHLLQISRFGYHRGLFAKILPKTSLKISYFIPSLFLIGLFLGPFISPHYYFLTLGIYLLLLVFSAFIHRSVLLIPTLFLTHLVYGLYFLKGLLSPQHLSRHLTTRVN